MVLAVLLDTPRHGYEVKRVHDEWFPSARPLAYGQVYATLARLQKDGLVEVVEMRVQSGPERTVYALTRRGRERVECWLDEIVIDAAPNPGELVRKTVVALRTASDPRPMLARQRTTYLRRMHDLRRAPDGDGLADLALDHALEHLDADVRWLDRAMERVGSGVTSTKGRAP